MYVKILYHPDSEHERDVLTFQRDFQHQTDKEVELLSLETREGSDLAELYDITTYPALLACKDDGVLMKLWQGERLPLINEVSYYAKEHETGSAETKHEVVIKPISKKVISPVKKKTPAKKTTKKPASKKK